MNGSSIVSDIGVELIPYSDNNLDNYIVKSPELVEAQYSLQLYEIKLLSYVISLINPDDDVLKTYTFSFSDATRIMGESTSNRKYEYLRKTIFQMQERFVYLPNKNLEIKDRPRVPWFTLAQVNSKDRTVSLQLHDQLKTYFLNLPKFTKYQFRSIWSLRSTYSVRMYELMRKNFWIDSQTGNIKKNTCDYTVAELREMFGIQPHEYKVYDNFRKRVIHQAQKEMKMSTELAFEYREEKLGRAIHRIYFTIFLNKDITNDEDDDILPFQQPSPRKKRKAAAEAGLSTGDPVEDIVTLLKAHGVYKSISRKWVKQYPVEHIRNNLEYALKAIEKSAKPIESKSGFIVAAVQEDWFGEKKEQEAQQEETKKTIELTIQAQHEEQLALLPNEVSKEDMERVNNFLDSIDAETILALRYQCKEYLQRTSPDGWGQFFAPEKNHPAHENMFKTYLLTVGIVPKTNKQTK